MPRVPKVGYTSSEHNLKKATLVTHVIDFDIYGKISNQVLKIRVVLFYVVVVCNAVSLADL